MIQKRKAERSFRYTLHKRLIQNVFEHFWFSTKKREKGKGEAEGVESKKQIELMISKKCKSVKFVWIV